MEKIELAIGETHIVTENGVDRKIVCVKDEKYKHRCVYCFEEYTIHCHNLLCCAFNRKDKTSVHFENVPI